MREIYKDSCAKGYMQEILKFGIGILVLILGFPIGHYLAKFTKEELKEGQRWFRLVLIACFIGAIASAFFRNDVLMFTFLFIAVVVSRSLKTHKGRN